MKIFLDEDAKMPNKAHEVDAGYDLFSRETKVIPAHGFGIFDTGVHMEIPEGYAGFLKSKSGLNVKHDLISDGVIDCGYTGSICVKLYNLGKNDFTVEKGDKITQIVLVKIGSVKLESVNDISDFCKSERGSNGFGSSGRK